MKIHILALWALLAAIGALGSVLLAASDLPSQSALFSQLAWNGPWIIPYLCYVGATKHARRAGSKEKPVGLQFVTALLTLLFAALLTGLMAGINTLLNQPSDIISSAVIMVVGLWESLLKGLFFSVITVMISDKLRKKTA